MADPVASPGHKLGQLVGVILQELLSEPLARFAARHSLYFDQQGERPGVRTGVKVTWRDSQGIPHDLDYVLERGGAPDRIGSPLAFIESAWRRYTKHSRAKSGELAGALLPLREAYPTVRFLGVILAGEYSEGGLQQLRSAGVEVLHVPFTAISGAYRERGLRIDYSEKATPAQKAALNEAVERSATSHRGAIKTALWKAIKGEYLAFERRLEEALNELPARVRIITLFGDETVYASVDEAIRELERPSRVRELDINTARGYELFVEYASGSTVRGRFQAKTELVAFLRRVQA